MQSGRRWVVRDRLGNEVYLTHERWQHIVEGHSEMRSAEGLLRQAIRRGRREQEPQTPGKFRYSLQLTGLPRDNTYVVAIVLFRFEEAEDGTERPNNYVVTAFQKQAR